MKRLISAIIIIFLLTSATIIFEIGLSRLFSYMLSYHFVLIIIAFSILGIGIGQIVYSRYFTSIEKSLNTWYALLPASLIFSYSLLLLVPGLKLFSAPNSSLFVFVLLSILPFIFIGIIYAHLFQDNKQQVSLLYGVDLIGAATGALLSVFLLNSLSLMMVVGISVTLLFLAFTIKLLTQKPRYSKVMIPSLIIIIALLWFGKGNLNIEIPILQDPSKDMLRIMSNPAVKSEIIDSRWSAFGKTDLVNLDYPGGYKSQVLFIDGAAGSDVINIDELLADSSKMQQELNLGNYPALFAMSFLNQEALDSVLIIGPGGGIDIAATYFIGFDFIEAVEVNPSFVALMKKYNQPTFSDKETIKVHTKEGRYFVRENKHKYDAILLTIPVTKGGRSSDFYGLTENYLFTVEALSDYMEALTEEGVIIFTMHSEYEVYKMLSNYIEMKKREGVSEQEALKNIYIISNGMKPVMVIKKQPFEQERIENIHLAAHQYQLGNDVFYFPYISQIRSDSLEDNKDLDYVWYMFDEQLYDVSKGNYPFKNIMDASMINIYPVFDDAPYFFNASKGIPDSIFIPFLLALVIIVWFAIRQVKGWNIITFSETDGTLLRKKFSYLTLMSFLLGFSYFFMQAYLFQILNLKLSSPSQSFSLLLFSFLLGNGLGSLFTKSFRKAYMNKFMIITLVIIGVSLFTVFFLLPVFDAQLSKAGIVLILLFPSFFIGMPFPVLLKTAADFEHKNTLPVLLGVSSIAGVAASILAIIISILYGFKLVLILGMTSYLLLSFLAYKLLRFEKNYRSKQNFIKNKK